MMKRERTKKCVYICPKASIEVFFTQLRKCYCKEMKSHCSTSMEIIYIRALQICLSVLIRESCVSVEEIIYTIICIIFHNIHSSPKISTLRAFYIVLILIKGDEDIMT